MSEALKKLVELRRLSTQGEWMLSNSNEGQIHSPLWEVATDSYYNPKDEDEPCLQLEIHCGTMQDGIFISEAANSIEQIGKDYDSAQKKIEALTEALSLANDHTHEGKQRYKELLVILNTQEGSR